MMTTTDASGDFIRATEDLEIVPLVPDQGEDESDEADSLPFFSASVAGKDWTVETLVSQMRKGRIDLEPSFQRRNAWLSNRKSKLIESIVLGFPIPQIVLAEKLDKPGHFFVLDGKQRLLALRQFFVDPADHRDTGFDPLKINGLEVVKSLNGKDQQAMEDASPDQLAQVENHSIRTVVLSNWNSEELLLSLFLRLNTGSVPLSPQELRQALIPGRFMEWLDLESGNRPELRELLGNNHPDRRMADAELTLRHIAFSLSSQRYKGNLKQFLDDSSKEFNANWSKQEFKISKVLDEMGLAIRSGFELLGRDNFCKKWSGSKYERALNRAVFDVQVFSLSHPQIRAALAGRGEETAALFRDACDNNGEFVRSITTTTKTADAFLTRHQTWRDIVVKVGGVNYPLPSPLVQA